MTSKVIAKANTPSVKESSRLLGMKPAAFIDLANLAPPSSSCRPRASLVRTPFEVNYPARALTFGERQRMAGMGDERGDRRLNRSGQTHM
jgi:hypothetical protein